MPKRIIQILISLVTILTLMASWTNTVHSDFQTNQYESLTGKDTIYTFERPPEMEPCIKILLDSLDLIFKDGQISDVEKNYSTIDKLKYRIGSDFDRILVKKSKCSKLWFQFLKSLNGKSKSYENKDNHSHTEYYVWGVVKSRQGIKTYGQIDGLLKIQFDIVFDPHGKCTKNDYKKKFISVF